MKVPLVDLKAQLAQVGAELKAAINDVIDSTAYIMGPSVAELESRLSEYVGAEHAVRADHNIRGAFFCRTDNDILIFF